MLRLPEGLTTGVRPSVTARGVPWPAIGQLRAVVRSALLRRAGRCDGLRVGQVVHSGEGETVLTGLLGRLQGRSPTSAIARPAAPVLAPVARGFAVVDVETTGLFPAGHDRVIEVGVVVLDGRRVPTDAWTTLINPRRDVGPTRIHGITASQVADAPTFPEIAGDLSERLADRVLVGHNVRFDLAFLAAEFGALGADLSAVEGLDTMVLASGFWPGGRSLRACCEGLGIDAGGVHHALADAEATTSLFTRCVTLAVEAGASIELPTALPRRLLPSVAPSGRVVTRDTPRPAPQVTLAGLAARLPTAAVRVDGEGNRLDAYVELLDRALEDRCLSADELEGLAATAAWLGITAPALEQIHRAYFAGLAQLALADGIVTESEREDLVTVATLLGAPDAVAELTQPIVTPGLVVDRAREWRGKHVCFTGESMCRVAGMPLDRVTQEQLAAEAGLIVEERVTRRLDLLVLADPASTSGKARLAGRYGVRKVAERAFWASLGVGVDSA